MPRNLSVNANPQRLESADGLRSALGRNVKCSGPNHTWTVVETWTLKERKDGRWVEARRHCDAVTAQAWINGSH